jgi:hypothetical protein
MVVVKLNILAKAQVIVAAILIKLKLPFVLLLLMPQKLVELLAKIVTITQLIFFTNQILKPIILLSHEQI